MDHAEQSCKSRGSRLTTKRKQLLMCLIKSEKAMSAYGLIDLCKEEFGDSIPAMSVYRILEFLEEEKLVHKLKLTNKYVACSHITCEHDHGAPQFLICSNCDQVKEIRINTSIIAELQKNVESVDYQLVNTQLEMNCLCKYCVTA